MRRVGRSWTSMTEWRHDINVKHTEKTMRQNEEIKKTRSSLICISVLRQRMGVDRRSLQPARGLWGSLCVMPSPQSQWPAGYEIVWLFVTCCHYSRCSKVEQPQGIMWSFSATKHFEVLPSMPKLWSQSCCLNWDLRWLLHALLRWATSYDHGRQLCQCVTQWPVSYVTRHGSGQRSFRGKTVGHLTYCCLHLLTFLGKSDNGASGFCRYHLRPHFLQHSGFRLAGASISDSTICWHRQTECMY